MFVNDIVLLCESWTHDKCDLHIDGYECIFKNRVKKRAARRPSGGIVCYFKTSIWKGVQEVKWENNEDGVIFRLNKTFFGWEQDLLLFFTYMRPRSSSRNDVINDSDCYDMLIDKIAEIEDDASILLCGDLNARISLKDDVIIEDESMHINNLTCMHDYDQLNTFYEHDFHINNMNIKRKNRDMKTNVYGNRLIQVCQTCSLVILNGRSGFDRESGQTTCWNERGSSAVDYIVCDKRAMYLIYDFCVHDKFIHSDHQIISCNIKCNISEIYNTNTLIGENNNNNHGHTNNVINNNTNSVKSMKAKWSVDLKQDYVNNIQSDNIISKVTQITDILNGNLTEDLLDRCVSDIAGIFTDAGDSHIFSQTVPSDFLAKKPQPKHKWYDNECTLQRNIFLERAKRFQETNLDEDRVLLCKERNKYRKLCRIKRRNLNRERASHIAYLSKSNPNAFWKEIKYLNKTSNCKNKLPDIDFFSHFKKLAERDAEIGTEGIAAIESSDIENYSKTIEYLDCPFTIVELKTAIHLLKNNKSS